MRSAQERTKSLQEAFEQSIILKSVHLEPENQRVAVATVRKGAGGVSDQKARAQ
jgi:hypothetical protein